MEPDRRVVAGREDDPQARRPASEEALQLAVCLCGGELVEVVDHEHDLVVEPVKLGDEPVDERLAVELRGRGAWLDQLFGVRDGAERIDDLEPEALQIELAAIDGHPRGPGREALGGDPRPQEDSLSAPRRRRNQRDGSLPDRREASEQ
jgi:hypothetical protein